MHHQQTAYTARVCDLKYPSSEKWKMQGMVQCDNPVRRRLVSGLSEGNSTDNVFHAIGMVCLFVEGALLGWIYTDTK